MKCLGIDFDWIVSGDRLFTQETDEHVQQNPELP